MPPMSPRRVCRPQPAQVGSRNARMFHGQIAAHRATMSYVGKLLQARHRRVPRWCAVRPVVHARHQGVHHPECLPLQPRCGDSSATRTRPTTRGERVLLAKRWVDCNRHFQHKPYLALSIVPSSIALHGESSRRNLDRSVHNRSKNRSRGGTSGLRPLR